MNRSERRHPRQAGSGGAGLPAPKAIGTGRLGFGNVAASKGIGPNKACGHKGGICRQGSKRG